MIRLTALVLLMSCVACEAPLVTEPEPAVLDQPDLPSDHVRSGYTFLTADTQALQDEVFENPGYLWVDRGETLFQSIDGGVSKPCIACHQSGALDGVAATYPKIDPETGDLINLEGRINLCRQRHQGAQPLGYESDALLALTTYVASHAQGHPVSVVIDETTQPYYETGRDYYFTRKGQLNLACSQCHDERWGQKLRGDTISQGHGNGFPAYRLEWQALGSLHRRFQDCDIGVRAEPFEGGADTYIALELYLAARAKVLQVETPAVRR